MFFIQHTGIKWVAKPMEMDKYGRVTVQRPVKVTAKTYLKGIGSIALDKLFRALVKTIEPIFVH